MRVKKKAVSRKKVKYAKVSISIPQADKKLYLAHCKSEGLSLKRLIKKLLKEDMKKRMKKVEVAANQLDLFAPSLPIQTKLPIFMD